MRLRPKLEACLEMGTEHGCSLPKTLFGGACGTPYEVGVKPSTLDWCWDGLKLGLACKESYQVSPAVIKMTQ